MRRPAPPSFRRRGRRRSPFTPPAGSPPEARHAHPHLPRPGGAHDRDGAASGAPQPQRVYARSVRRRHASRAPPPRTVAHAMADQFTPGLGRGQRQVHAVGRPEVGPDHACDVRPARRVSNHPADQQACFIFHQAAVACCTVAQTSPCAVVKMADRDVCHASHLPWPHEHIAQSALHEMPPDCLNALAETPRR